MDSCLLCCAAILDTSSTLSTTPPLVDRSARVIFLLRKLLNLAPTVCEDLVRKHGHPADWISLCPTCDDIVTQGTCLFDQIKKLELEFDAVKEEVKKLVTVKQEIREDDGDHDMGDSATRTIRRHLACCGIVGGESDLRNGIDIGGEIYPDICSMKIEEEEIDPGNEDALSTTLQNVEIPVTFASTESQPTSKRRNKGLKGKLGRPPLKTGNVTRSKRNLGKKSKRKQRFNFTREKKFGKDGMDLDVEIHPPNFKFDLEDNEEGLVNHLENEIFEKIISTPDTQQFQPPKRGRGRPRKQICAEQEVVKVIPLSHVENSDSDDEESDPDEDDHDPDYSGEESLKSGSSPNYCHSEPASPPPDVLLSWLEIISAFPPPPTVQDETLAPYQRRKIEFERLAKIATKHRITSFPCPHCAKEIATIPSWSSHVDWCSGKTVGYKCDTCEKVVRARHTLETHVLSRHIPREALTCRGCGKFYPRCEGFEDHVKENADCAKHAIFCPHKPCGGVFTSEQVCEIHAECRHSVINPYKCGVPGCGRSFGVKHKLKSHMEMYHSGRNSFVCDQCGKEFREQDNLRSHVKRVHLSRAEGAPRFPCDVCGKEMISKSKLNRHKQIHINPDDAPHLCTLCGKRYRLKEYLNIHMRSHDPDRREKYSHYMPKKKKRGDKEVKMGVAGARIGRPKKTEGKIIEIRESDGE